MYFFHNQFYFFVINLCLLFRHAASFYICDSCSCISGVIDCSMKNFSLADDEVSLPEYFTTIDLSDNEISELTTSTFLDVPHSIENIDLSGNNFETITEETFSQFMDLRSISLRNNLISDIEETAFYNQSTLYELDLSFNQIEILEQTTFYYLIELKNLDLSFNHLVDLDEHLFQSLQNLQTLDLSFSRLQTLQPAIFDWNLSIKTLDLSHNFLTSVPTQTLWNVRNTLENLRFSGNLIKTIPKGAFMELGELRKIKMEQILQLKKIDQYAFQDLKNLEVVTLKYLPRIISIHPKAFHLEIESVNGSAAPLCPIQDFTLEFTTLMSLSQELLNWEELRYLSFRNNRWFCDCNLIWMRDSPTISKLTGKTIYCLFPKSNSGHLLLTLEDKDLTCNIFLNSSKTGVGLVAVIIFLGISISFCTVAFLFYRRNGWLLNPPPTIDYGRLASPPANTITIYDRGDAAEMSYENIRR